MKDDWEDDRKVSSLMTESLLRRKARKIAETYPRQSQAIRRELKELAECEKAGSTDIDRTRGASEG